jgi:hypothetical protein
MGYVDKPRDEALRCTRVSASTGQRCMSRFTLRGSEPRVCNRHATALDRVQAAENLLHEAGDGVIEAWRRGDIPTGLLPVELMDRARSHP